MALSLSAQAMPEAASTFRLAIEEAPGDLLPNFCSLREILLSPSLISNNDPLYLRVLSSITYFKQEKAIPPLVAFAWIKSCQTKEANEEFYSKFGDLIAKLDLSSKQDIQKFIQTVGLSGIHVLSGYRKTVGTDDCLLPPPSPLLIEAFRKRFKDTELTCGGRALSKHCVRDSSGFWGKCEGPVTEINEAGENALNKLISSAVWHNIFALPHDGRAYEIREPRGYGARWEFVDGGSVHFGNIQFRGFVEPPMEDGHLKRWRH